jgi:hypothetical protein
MFNAKTVNGFLTPEESKQIIDFVKEIDVWESGGGDGFWDNRCLNAITIYNRYSKEMGKTLYDVRERVREEIKKLYGLDEVYPDIFQVVRWFPGMEQTPHSDDMVYAKDQISEELLKEFSYREFGSIVYLNDNYSGGHTYYPNYNFDIKPEAGKLAVHPGDPEHLHGVSKIEGTTRYTLAAFWSRNKDYFDDWVL